MSSIGGSNTLTLDARCRQIVINANHSKPTSIAELLRECPEVLSCHHPDLDGTLCEFLLMPETLAACTGLLEELLGFALARIHHLLDWNAVAANGLTLHHRLCIAGERTLASTLQASGVLHHPQFPASGNSHGHTPMHFMLYADVRALMCADPPANILEVVAQLLAGLNISASDCAQLCTPDRKTLLHWAGESRCTPVWDFLRANGADVNAVVIGDGHGRRTCYDFLDWEPPSGRA